MQTKTTKSLLATVVIMLLLCMIPNLPAKADDAYCSFTGQEYFAIDPEGNLTAYTGAAVDVIVPPMVAGVEVRGITTAFMNNENIESLVLPDSLQIIGDGAFTNCGSLSSIGVYTLIPQEQLALEAANGTWISKSSRITETVGASTNYYYIVSNGNKAVLPSHLSYVGTMAFRGTISLGGFVTNPLCAAVKAGSDTCTLKDVTGADVTYNYGPLLLSANGTTLLRWASAYHHAGEYSLPEGIVAIADCACEHADDVQGFAIPSTVTTIGAYAFSEGNNINTITFAENSQVTTIGEYAFAYNDNLKSELPASVTTLGVYCYSNCQNLILDISKSSLTAIPDYCFYECNNYHFTTFPETLTSIGKYAFYACDNINNVYFTDKIKSIGEGAFKDCQNLHSIKIPEGLTVLKADTFSGCQNLNEIELPDSLKKIESGAFEDCENIHKLVIPPNVTYIAPDSFEGVKVEAIDASQNAYAMSKIPGLAIKKGSPITYKTIKYSVVNPSKKSATVQVIGCTNKNIKKLTIPATIKFGGVTYKVVSIKNSAFKKYKKLQSITIGNNVTAIGNNAFQNCPKLTSVTIGSKVKTIGSAAFASDKALKTIRVKSKYITKVGTNALKGISSKATITLNKSKYTKLKKLFSKKGQPKTVKYKKG